MTGSGKDPARLIATASQTVGPFFHFALTPDGVRNEGRPDTAAPAMQLVVRVTDGQGQAVGDAMIEIWIARGDGPCAFARLPTQADGTCSFDTVRPAAVAGDAGARQAAHVNVCLFARGLLRQLHTRIYFAGDPALDDDAVLALVPADRRGTLVATPDSTHADRWIFHVRLQGSDETVFFDV
jgi:protocatechuate 3,4-dioxygenase alpha subunit